MNINRNEVYRTFHEAGHLLACFHLFGEIDYRHIAPAGLKFNTPEGYGRMFNTVCYYVAGGIAESLLRSKRVTKTNMVEDIDLLNELARHKWGLKFNRRRNGDPFCPVLDNLINACIDYTEAQFRTLDSWATLKKVSTYLERQNVFLPDIIILLNNPVAHRHRQEITAILETYNFRKYEKDLRKTYQSNFRIVSV